MDSKLDKLKKEAKKLGIELDANETIADLEAKIAQAELLNGDKHDMKAGDGPAIKTKKDEVAAPRRQPVKRINFTRRIDREAKDNGTR